MTNFSNYNFQLTSNRSAATTKDRSNTLFNTYERRVDTERPHRNILEVTMTHDNFPGHYTAYKTYIIALRLLVAQLSAFAHFAATCFPSLADLSGGSCI